jgi:predicted phosphodiesterase
MKIAVISDIHSNVFALEAVLHDAKWRGFDMMLNLGDTFYGCIAPGATYDCLVGYDIVAIGGNQDRQLHEATPEELAANPTLRFVLDDLGDEPIDWLKMLPFDRRLNDDVYICHGTPTDDLIYLLEDVSSGRPVLRTDAEIIGSIAGIDAPVILCGHSHQPQLITLESGQLVVNPGSVGLQAYTDDEPCDHVMETRSPQASYAMIEKSGSTWTVQQLRVAYDHHKAAAEAIKHNREDWAHFLVTGRA